MKFNLNDYVTVKLTANGLHIYTTSDYYRENRVTMGGTLREQAWVVMHVFGSFLWSGAEQVFVDNVWTVEPSL